MTKRLYPLFPICVTENYCSISKKQLNYFIEQKKCAVKNFNNQMSGDKNVLDHKLFKQLKNKINECLDDYVLQIYSCDSIKVHITQSWLNFCEKGQSHHAHVHPNSFLSGVLYIKANPNYHSIRFTNSSYNNIFPYNERTQWSDFNSKCYDIPVEEGKLIIFPSRLMHDVSRNTQDDLRISLSFNTWIKGEVGSKENADYLKL